MSEYGYCPDCSEYAGLAQHRQLTRVYEARFEPEDDWERTCGDHYEFLEDQQDGPKTAAERFCRKIDQEDSHRIEDNRTVWVRLQGQEGDGQPYQVATEMVPEYHATELSPCPGGCGKLTSLAAKCHPCMRADWDAERAVRKAGAA